MFLITTALFLAIFSPIGLYYLSKKKLPRKLVLAANLLTFAAVFILANFFIFSGRVYANTATATADITTAAAFIAAALVTGLGAIGTGIAVSSTAAAAIGAISENEANFGKAMIFVAMAEGIAIYGLLISFMILGRV